MAENIVLLEVVMELNVGFVDPVTLKEKRPLIIHGPNILAKKDGPDKLLERGI